MLSTQYPTHTDLKFIQSNTNSFLLTGSLVSSLTHTHTHRWASFKDSGFSLTCSFLCKCFIQTHKSSNPATFVNTHTQYCIYGPDTRCESDSYHLQIFPVPQIEELVSQHGRVKTWGHIAHTGTETITHTHTQWDFTLTFDMLRNQRWSYTYFKLKLFQWMSFWGIIRALFVKTDLFKDANPLKKTPKATSWRYTFCTDLKQFILLTPSPILVNKRLNLFAQSFEFLFSVSHNS